MALYEKVGEYSEKMEKIIQTRADQRQAELTMEWIKDEYNQVFGEEMSTEE